MKPRAVLPFHYAVQLKATEGWLALGHLDEVFAEWRKLPRDIRLHPEAAPVREKLLRFWKAVAA